MAHDRLAEMSPLSLARVKGEIAFEPLSLPLPHDFSPNAIARARDKGDKPAPVAAVVVARRTPTHRPEGARRRLGIRNSGAEATRMSWNRPEIDAARREARAFELRFKAALREATAVVAQNAPDAPTGAWAMRHAPTHRPAGFETKDGGFGGPTFDGTPTARGHQRQRARKAVAS